MFPDEELITISMRYVVTYCVSLPIGAFFTCIFLAITLHPQSTSTHCHVDNFLPSISAAIGDYAPECYIWRICIALHCAPRFLIGWCYKNHYLTSPLRPLETNNSKMYKIACWLTFILHGIENMSLVILSMITSSENFGIHKMAFCLFVFFGWLYMLLTLWLVNYSGRRRSSSLGEKSFQWKLIIFTTFMGAFLCSLYFYWRHNRHCEPGVYTLFALCEYTVVLCVIGFHSTLYYDMYDKKFVLQSGQIDWKLLDSPAGISIDKTT